MIGKRFLNYKILSKIGEGGMGVVYKALDTNLDRVVAIKVLHREFSKNKELVERFKIEGKVQAKLIHPNICTLFALFEHEDNLFMVMEYIEGVSLSEILEKKGKLSVKQALSIFLQVLKGISVAHKAGIIHRDIKPSNILISKDGTVKVMDFGIAKIKGASKLTKTGMHVGTIYYMSPEQIKGGEIDFRSDIYSLGATLFETIAGRPPFEGRTEFEILEAHVKTPPPIPSKFNSKIPKAVSDIITKSLAKNPEDRFQNADEFKRAIEIILKNGHPVQKKNMAKTILEDSTLQEDSPKFISLLTGKKKIILASTISAVFILTLIIALLLIGGKKKNEIPVTSNIGNISGGSSAPISSQETKPINPIVPQSNTTTLPSKEVISIAKDIASNIFKKENKVKNINSEKRNVKNNKPIKIEKKEVKNNTTEPRQETVPQKTEATANQSVNNGFQFDELLKKINNCYEMGNIYSPPKDNALYYYILARRQKPNAPELNNLKDMLFEEIKIALESSITNGELEKAKKIYNLAEKAFPNDTSLGVYKRNLESAISLYSTLKGAKVFYVLHDHSGDFTRYCAGMLYIKGDILGYVTLGTNDGRRDDFKVHLYSIKEVKKNFWDIGGFKCFHIKLKNGKNYNFTLTNKNGNMLDPSIFVSYYNSLK